MNQHILFPLMRISYWMIEYRLVTANHITSMLELWKTSGLPIREGGRESCNNLELELKENPRGFIGAWDGDSFIGVVIATSDGRKGWINRLVIAPSYRRKGIGTELIRLAEKELKSRGINIISALIEKGADSSFALFRKAGYQICDDIIYLRKELIKGA